MERASVEFNQLVEAEGVLKGGGEVVVEDVAGVADEAVPPKVKQLQQSLKNQQKRR